MKTSFSANDFTMIGNSKLLIPSDGDITFETAAGTIPFKTLAESKFEEYGNQKVIMASGVPVFRIDVRKINEINIYLINN